jgi:hypothetical protein
MFLFMFIWLLTACGGDNTRVTQPVIRPTTDPVNCSIKTLINGQVTQSPEIVVLSISNKFCTATMIGPRVAITAAHCNEPDAKPAINGQNGTFYLAPSLDIGVVVLPSPVPGPYASVYTAVPKIGEPIEVFGYGCTGNGSENDFGTLRSGIGKVDGLDSQYISFSGKPALCFGDSGGPTTLAHQQQHYVIAINSRGNIVDKSLSSRLDVPEAAALFKQLLPLNLEICGINKTCAPPPCIKENGI